MRTIESFQPALLILDVFSGQMVTPAMAKLAENHMKYVKVPANMTNLFQLLDLTINRSAKAFMKKNFAKWYSLEAMKQHDTGKSIEEIKLLSKLKPVPASWLIELYNHFISTAGKEITSSFDRVDPFSTIDPWEEPADDEIFGRKITYRKTAFLTESSTNFEIDDEDEWVFEDSLTEDRIIF